MSTTQAEGPVTIDVRDVSPRERHPRIFALWDSVADGDAMVLINDHDPVPLYYQFAAENAGGYRWEYLERGPEVWRVRISRGRFEDPGFRPEVGTRGSCRPAVKAEPIEFVRPLTLDVRAILAGGGSPCGPIEEAIGRLIPGQTLVVLVPFEPVPLYTKLGMCGFTHETRRLEDGTWRVEFRPGAEADPERFEACGAHNH